MIITRRPIEPSPEPRLSHRKLQLLAEKNQGFDPRAYSSSMEFYFESTNEKKVAAKFIITQVMPSLKRREKMLDVGFGDGRLTRMVGRNFEEVVACEKYSPEFERTAWRSLTGKKNFTAVCGRFPEVGFVKENFDFVLASHVLYYSKPDRWMELANAAFQSIRPGGAALFVNNSENGEAGRMQKKFGGGYPVDQFAERCKNQYGAETFELGSLIFGHSIKEAVRLSQFLLFDALHKINLIELTEYVEAHFRMKDGTYEIRNPQKVILIQKE